MEAGQKVLTVEPCEWSAQVADVLARAFTHGNTHDLGRDVRDGRAALFGVRQGGELAGAWFVLRIDGDEGVIVAAAGAVPGVDLVADVVPEIEGMFRGVRRIRIHTSRPGMVKKLARQGYGAAEVVLFKELGQ